MPKPVAAVPPDVPAPGRLRRVLVPLEGTVSTSLAPRSMLELAGSTSLDVVVLHVHDDGSGGAEQDAHAFLALRAVGDRARAAGAAPRSPRGGRAGGADALDVDLVALGWARALEPGRAPMVQAALARPIPVLLIPVEVGAGEEAHGLANAAADERGER